MNINEYLNLRLLIMFSIGILAIFVLLLLLNKYILNKFVIKRCKIYYKKDVLDFKIKIYNTLFVMIGIVITMYIYINNVEVNRKIEASRIILGVQDKLNYGWNCAIFLSKLSDDEVTLVKNYKPIDIEINKKTTRADIHDLLDKCLAGQNDKGFIEKSKEDKNHEKLTARGSYYVYTRATHDLDLLETLAESYYMGVVDKEMIANIYSDLFIAARGFISKLRSMDMERDYIFLEQYIKQEDNKKFP